MTVMEGLNLREYTAAGINTGDDVYKALFSDDAGNGALALELDALVGFINYYTRTDDVRGHKDSSLELIVNEFLNFKRRVMEKDGTYLTRFLAVTERKKDLVWGTKWNIKHVFEAVFSDTGVFIAENTSDINLIENGDFEGEYDNWTVEGGAEINYGARFSGTRGLCFNGAPGSAAWSARLEDGVYFLHFFLRGNIGLEIGDSAGKYWNADKLEWSDSPLVNKFESGIWDNMSMFIKIPPGGEETVEIKFTGGEDNKAFLDYVRLYKKLPYPSYTVISKYAGYFEESHDMDKICHLGKGTEDPDSAVTWYEKESYFDHCFLTGIGTYRNDLYSSLLDLIRPKGIRVFMETHERVNEEGETVSAIGDLIGGVDTYGHLPAVNTGVSGAGLSLLPSVKQIRAFDLVVVSDASGDGHGINAVYEADTASMAGDGVTWVFLYNTATPKIQVQARTGVLSSSVREVAGDPPALSEEVKAAWDANPASVEVRINGLGETGFTIDGGRKLQLTGYTADGWTADDTVEVFAWL